MKHNLQEAKKDLTKNSESIVKKTEGLRLSFSSIPKVKSVIELVPEKEERSVVKPK